MGVKYNSVSSIKGISCLTVVLIHAFGGGPLKRFAVPLFFMISGYFLRNNLEGNLRKKVLKKGAQTLFLGIKSLVLLILLYIILFPGKIVLSCISLNSFRTFLLFNHVPCAPIGDHLWFVFALSYCYLIYYFVMKYNKSIFLVWIFAAIFIVIYSARVGLSLNDYYFLGKDLSKGYLYRNWLTHGISWFSIGYLIRHYKKYWYGKISRNTLLAGIIGGLIFGVIESYIIGVDFDFYISSPLVSVGLFLWALQNPGNSILVHRSIINWTF